MKCYSCQTEIPSSFVHTLKSGICAACGGSLMSEDQKELMDELSTVIERLGPDDISGLAGWLLENFEMRKRIEGEINSPEFFGQRKRPKRHSDELEENESGFAPGLRINQNNPLDRIKNQQLQDSEVDQDVVDFINSEVPEEVLDQEIEKLASLNVKKNKQELTFNSPEILESLRQDRFQRNQAALSGYSNSLIKRKE